MRLLIGSIFALLALLWTGMAWVASAALQWAIGVLASGQATEMAKVVSDWPIPAWLTLWVDVGAIHALLDALVQGLEWLQQTWPLVGSALGWLVPVIWVAWGFGLLLLVLIGTVAWLAVGRSRPRTLPARASP